MKSFPCHHRGSTEGQIRPGRVGRRIGTLPRVAGRLAVSGGGHVRQQQHDDGHARERAAVTGGCAPPAHPASLVDHRTKPAQRQHLLLRPLPSLAGQPGRRPNGFLIGSQRRHSGRNSERQSPSTCRSRTSSATGSSTSPPGHRRGRTLTSAHSTDCRLHIARISLGIVVDGLPGAGQGMRSDATAEVWTSAQPNNARSWPQALNAALARSDRYVAGACRRTLSPLDLGLTGYMTGRGTELR